MEDLIILGAGTMAQEVTELAEEQGQYRVIAYAVNVPDPLEELNGLPVLRLEELEQWSKRTRVIRGIYQPIIEFVNTVDRMGFWFATIIHPSASIARSATISPGAVINRLVAIGTAAVIGKHSLINRSCTIGHHTKLGEAVTMGPGANIAGNCNIGDEVMIGMGANIIENMTIEAGRTIKAGSLTWLNRDKNEYNH